MRLKSSCQMRSWLEWIMCFLSMKQASCIFATLLVDICLGWKYARTIRSQVCSIAVFSKRKIKRVIKQPRDSNECQHGAQCKHQVAFGSLGVESKKSRWVWNQIQQMPTISSKYSVSLFLFTCNAYTSKGLQGSAPCAFFGFSGSWSFQAIEGLWRTHSWMKWWEESTNSWHSWNGLILWWSVTCVCIILYIFNACVVKPTSWQAER